MKSKTSLFNKTIFTKNIKRVWPFWGLLSFAAVMPSIVIFMEWIRNDFVTEVNNPLSVTEIYYEASIYMAPFVAFATAILVAMMIWGYLYNAKSVSAFHSFPITRVGLFVTNYLSGLAIMLIPYVIGGALFVLTLLIIGVGFDMAVFTLIGSVLMNSVFFFSLATLVAMLTGHILALPVLYLVFNFLSLAIENLFSFVVCSFLFGFDYSGTAKTAVLSPLYHILSECNVKREYTYHWGEKEYYRIREVSSVQLENFGIIVMYAVVGVVIAALALLVYRKKKSETAGDVVSVKPLKPIIHGIYTITGTTLLGLLLYYILSEGNLERFSVILGVVCFTIALAISFYTGLMLLDKTIKVFNKKAFVNFLIGMVVVVFGCFGLKYDVFGLEKKIPDVSDIQWVDVYTSSNSYNLPAYKAADLIEKTVNINKEIVENKDMIMWRSDDWGANFTHTYLNLRYHLYNGDTVERYYMVPVDNDSDRDFDRDYIEYLTDKDLVSTLFHKDDGYQIRDAYQTFYFNNYETSVSYGFSRMDKDFDEKEAGQLFKALEQDLAAGNWQPGLSYFESGDTTIGYLNINFEKEIHYSDSSRYFDTDNVVANLTGRMTNTLKALAELNGVTYEQMMEAVKELEKENEYRPEVDEIVY